MSTDTSKFRWSVNVTLTQDDLLSRPNLQSRQFDLFLNSDFITGFVLCLCAPWRNTALNVSYVLLLILSMPAEINSNFRGVQETTNNSNS